MGAGQDSVLGNLAEHAPSRGADLSLAGTHDTRYLHPPVARFLFFFPVAS